MVNAVYKGYKCVIGIDQSYTCTGLAVSVSGRLKLARHIDFDSGVPKVDRRRAIVNRVERLIKKCIERYGAENVCIIMERVRQYMSADNGDSIGFRSPVLSMFTILSLYSIIVSVSDVASLYGVPVFSVDTRSWKSAVLGSSKSSGKKLKGVDKQNKVDAVRFVIGLGFEDCLRIELRGGKFKYCDDAADAACISLYGFAKRPKLFLESS